MLDSSAQQSDSVIHINTHIYSFFRFFFIIVYYKIRVQFPMLYSRSLLAICFIQSSESCRSLIREWWILVFLTAGWSLRSTHLKVSWKRHIWGWKGDLLCSKCRFSHHPSLGLLFFFPSPLRVLSTSLGISVSTPKSQTLVLNSPQRTNKPTNKLGATVG